MDGDGAVVLAPPAVDVLHPVALAERRLAHLVAVGVAVVRLDARRDVLVGHVVGAPLPAGHVAVLEQVAGGALVVAVPLVERLDVHVELLARVAQEVADVVLEGVDDGAAEGAEGEPHADDGVRVAVVCLSSELHGDDAHYAEGR